jgi:hypothetical protein
VTNTPTAIVAIGLLALLTQDRRAPPAPTRIVHFTPPHVASGSSWPGTCRRSVVSDRVDAYRCVTADTTDDPCFATDRTGLVLCGADPRDSSSGTIVSMSAPAESRVGPRGESLRAWFFELEDGSTCRPLIFGDGREVDRMVELYTCRFAPPGGDAVLGDIDTRAPVWTIQQASLNKRMPPLSIKQLVSAVVKTAWQ